MNNDNFDNINDDDISDIVLSDGEMIEEVYDNDGDDDSGYCIMKYNDKFYYCGFDCGGTLGSFEEFNSLEDLRKEIVFE